MLDPITGIQKWFKNSTPQKKLTTVLLVISLLATGIFFVLSGASESSSDPLTATPLYFIGVFAKLVGVLLLIIAVAVVYNRWLRLSPRAGVVRQLRLLETVRLSPRQALHLVSVGDQQILIGATDQSISLLTSLEGGSISNDVEGTQITPGMDFGAVLQSFNSELPGGSPAEKE